MPIYEYRCLNCKRKVSLFWATFKQAETGKAVCTHCGSDRLSRLVSKVAVVRTEDARLESLADPDSLGDIDENDPKSIARWMRKMSAEAGEDAGPELDEVINRLEAGQSPEQIEQDMPDLAEGNGMADDE
jgi:putative FmdB family regulatory protein